MKVEIVGVSRPREPFCRGYGCMEGWGEINIRVSSGGRGGSSDNFVPSQNFVMAHMYMCKH